jgi:hypothetical protein
MTSMLDYPVHHHRRCAADVWCRHERTTQYNPTLTYGTPYVIPVYTPPVAIITPGFVLAPVLRSAAAWVALG